MNTVEAMPLNVNLKGQDFLTLANFSTETIQSLLANEKKIKNLHLRGKSYTPLQGKILGMIFEKPSTRTRVSFEAGMLQLGGHAIYLNSHDMQLGRGETIEDTAKVLSQYVDAIMIRTFSHDIIEKLAAHATIPIINGLTDMFHPCQAMADLLTILEQKGTFKGLKLVYVGDGNNVSHSLMLASAKVGMDCVIACPKGFEPDESVIKLAKSIASENGSTIKITNDPLSGVTGADIIYTDVWTSMGHEEDEGKIKYFKEYQVNEKLVMNAKKDYLFMHCLPAHRELEVTKEVIDGPNSVVFQQAGNRLHIQKAILTEILKK
ncbi:ornithine carbamoyltransferase [Bacillus aquiflavi]|uniref:ornithine carbamoyltransferase n=1 Tax=Bacillus aquiflavi TaxID=2672567 RepID=UPI001CA99A3C|nr:ornithine carbamoyltransferase [Bacillus aquiflavi]UAC49071.1 ornithine carbamoyltransferase [Bacillus aquiflavi]